uniref:ZP domain-containing protein n=1 Tax=Leptobrachium leishanense TaxID=445787 RepID=A0A8C5PIX5_9ANUR
METIVDLGTRSDTLKPNHSPVTTILPNIRVPGNCPTTFQLLAHDPDGDIVRCRYGVTSGECHTCHNNYLNFNLNKEKCILSTSSSVSGVYLFELMMEDFPRNDLILSYDDGSVSYKYTTYFNNLASANNSHWLNSDATSAFPNQEPTELYQQIAVGYGITPTPVEHILSKIPLQFTVEVTNSVPSCTYGVYRPLLLPPTPNQGAILTAKVGVPFQLHLSAQASHSSITDFKVTGPNNTTRGTIYTSGYETRMTVAWTPTDNDDRQRAPFCFAAETSNGLYSEYRCIIVIVDGSYIGDNTVVCNENTMTLYIEKSFLDGTSENDLQLNDPQCLVSSNSTHYIASVGFNSCGTEIEETGDSIVFKNQVTSVDNITDVITRTHQVAIPFSCSFSKEERLSVSFRPHKAIFEFAEAGFGNFTYKFQFYTDDQFITVQTQSPLELLLRDMLYLEIEVTSSLSNIELFVESCRATPHDNPNDPVFYNIIENGCSKDETLVIYPGTSTKSRFGLEAFAFIGSYEEVYISCTVMMCKNGDPDTRCSRGCTTKSLAAHRGKRSLTEEATESLQHLISQGPLRMKQSSSEGAKEKTMQNDSTLVMCLSGVVIVAIVGITIFFSLKKAKINKYERLSTEEF